MLGQCLLGGYTSGGQLVELSAQPPGFTLDLAERPVTSPLARLQAQTSHRVTNLRHETVLLDEVARHLLTQLDGGHDRQALAEVLVGLVGEGQLDLEADGQPVRAEEQIRAFAVQTVEQLLPALARHALLLG